MCLSIESVRHRCELVPHRFEFTSFCVTSLVEPQLTFKLFKLLCLPLKGLFFLPVNLPFERYHVLLYLFIASPELLLLGLHCLKALFNFSQFQLLRAQFVPKDSKGAFFYFFLKVEVLLCGKLGFLLSFSRLFKCFLLITLQLDSFFLKFLFDGDDFLLFVCELFADFVNLALELFFQLNDTFFAALKVGSLDPHFVLQGCNLGYRLVERLLSLLLFELPVLS